MVEKAELLFENDKTTFIGTKKKITVETTVYGNPVKAYWFSNICIVQFDEELGTRFDNVSAFDLEGKKIYTIESRSDKLGKKSWCNFGIDHRTNTLGVGNFFGFGYDIINPLTGELSEPVNYK